MRQHFFQEGNWYKGNTHTHSTVSDGMMTPEDLTELYRNAGYSFMSFTDHEVYSIHEDLNRDDFLVIPGTELKSLGARGDRWGEHHIVGLGIPGENRFAEGQEIPYSQGWPVQKVIDLLRDNGNLVIYAHPNWSHTSPQVLSSLKGVLAMEIYNHISEVTCGCGYSVDFYNQLLWEGCRQYCISCDDAHQIAKDYLGGFIMVKAPELTHKSIFEALTAGSFYASNGPLIKELWKEGDKIHVECSPCRMIAFLSDKHRGSSFYSEEGGLTSADFYIPEGASYVRVDCQDAAGHTAWSNPFWLT